MKPVKLPAVGGHGAEMRPLADGEVQMAKVRPMDVHLKKRFTEIGDFDPFFNINDPADFAAAKKILTGETR